MTAESASSVASSKSEVRRAVQSEGIHRLALCAAMLPFPGFGDHFPCEYEIALRQELQLSLP